MSAQHPYTRGKRNAEAILEESGNMKTVSLTSTEYRALKDSGQMTDIGALDGTYGGDSPNYPIWDGRTMEWVMVVVVK